MFIAIKIMPKLFILTLIYSSMTITFGEDIQYILLEHHVTRREAPNIFKPTITQPGGVELANGIWYLNYPHTDISCVLLAFALQLEVHYTTTNHITSIAVVNVPLQATPSGECQNESDTQSITLAWFNANHQTHNITLTFLKNAMSKTYSLADIQVNLRVDEKDFPDASNEETQVNLHHTYEEFGTSLFHSYRSDKERKLNLTDNNNKPRGFINVSNLQFQVFMNSTKHQFTNVEMHDAHNVEAIAIGFIVATLVIIIIITCIVARRRDGHISVANCLSFLNPYKM